jgi:LacI family transcriptional regulator, gluconate utilization system Gnt-I transcriptional repressor
MPVRGMMVSKGGTRRVRQSRGSGQVRIEDVARQANVSAQTVSRFLRNPQQVSSDTAARIRSSIAEIGYVPNRVAGALASNRSHVVAILVPTIANPIHAAPVQALSDALRPAGYQVLVGTTGYDPAAEQDMIEAFLGRRVDGMVVTGTSLTAQAGHILQGARIPVVQLWEITDFPPLDMAVGVRNVDAGVAVARHFVERGYRRLAVVSHAAAGDTRSLARTEGFRREAVRLGLDMPLELAVTQPTDMGQGPGLLARLRAPGHVVEAVFCVGDPVAIGLVLACQRLGIVVPRDLAIASFGDSDLASLVSPPLTAVRIPRYDLGRIAGEMLLKRFAGEALEENIIDLGFTLMVRETS